MKQKSTVVLSVFEQQVKKVLKYFDDPARIGAESPLASPYFLSHALRHCEHPSASPVRGAVLCHELRQAAATLWGADLPQSYAEMRAALPLVRQAPGTPRYAYLVLELRCFQQYLKPPRLADIWEDENYLPGSQAEHYRDFDVAVSYLSQALLDRLRPNLRLEEPPVPASLIGYAAAGTEALAALRAGKTVSIHGPGGVGKTALGATLVNALKERPIFWYTLRPTLNDRLSSLLFALGHFLHALGAANLWQLILAAGGFVKDQHVALALLRQDLATLRAHAPLLCFDELDWLYAADPDQNEPGHIQILEWLQSLRGITPLLLISQQTRLEADYYLVPRALAPVQIQQLFQQAAASVTAAAAQALYQYTGGNPRLLLLCLALHQSGERVMEQVNLLEQTPDLAVLLHRLWQRLTPGERQLLQRLAVFRSATPVHAWGAEQAQLTSLVHRRLARLDGQGGVEVLPALRLRIYQELAPDLRAHLHEQAAELRLAYGQFTAAAYHYWQGNQPAQAIQRWYPYRAQEIQRGQGDAAFAIFRHITGHGLPEAARKALALLQAELYRLQGELGQGRARLAAQDWTQASEAALRAHTLQGEFLDALGYPDAALRAYNDGVVVATRLLSQLVTVRRQRGLLHLRQKDLQLAWREAQLAECQVHNLRGELEYESGRYAEARGSFQQAALLAQSLDDLPSLALAERNLANLAGRQQDLPTAERHALRAVEAYKRMNDQFGLVKVYGGMASIYLDTQQFTQAVHFGQLALDAAKIFPYDAAIAATNLAEAYFELGELTLAQQYAHQVLNLEERQPFPYALFTLGRIKQQQGNATEAHLHFTQALALAQENDDPFIGAYAQRELGLMAQASGDIGLAQQHLNAALTFFEGAGIAAEVAKTRQRMAPVVA